MTSPSVGYATVCDPFWLVCYPAAVSVDSIVGDRSSNDFGIYFGGGVTFGHEVKFHVVALSLRGAPCITPTATTLPAAAGTTATCSGGCSSNAAHFPVTFGFRF